MNKSSGLKARKSAGILVYRDTPHSREFLLVHPGGPFWANKDVGAWSIPKGLLDEDEEPLAAAVREFEEETGIRIKGEFKELQPVKQKTGKTILSWAVKSDIDIDIANITSNLFEMEWPPRSGKLKSFPEVDKAAWFVFEEAVVRIVPGQVPIIKQLQEMLDG